MPEGVIQPERDYEQSAPDRSEDEPGASTAPAQVAVGQRIIWTPRFLLAFALTLVLGLSTDSLLTSGWSTGLFVGLGLWFILGHIVLAALGWLALGIVTRSRWIRVGSIFGGICILFLILNAFTQLMGVSPTSPAQSYINVASCTALLGAYIGLSIEGTLLSAWDFWLFWLLPLLSCIGVALTYFLTPQASLITVENAVAVATLSAACLVWWARPSCWKSCPGPTFIFGVIPIMQISLGLVNGSMHNFFLLQVLAPDNGGYSNLNNFFFVQFILLCLFLGCIRLIKSEVHN
ncbi:MAG TPA: hypothetical protein VGD98_22495 [Ktedonobacteraceae bacterium]